MKLGSFKNFAVKILVFFIGIFIVQLGVALFIRSEAGVDSYTIMMEGLARLFHITVGQANILLMFILFLGIFFFAREYIRIGTFLATFATGMFLDLANFLFGGLGIESLSYPVRLGVLAIGCIVIAIGFSILTAADLSVSPLDQLPLIIVDKTRFNYGQVRIVLDIIYITSGYLLGGTLGLGTVVALLLVGPCINFCLGRIGDPIRKWIATQV